MRRMLSGLLLFSALSAFGQSRKIIWPEFSEKTMAAIQQRFPNFANGTWTQEQLDQVIQYLVVDEQYDSVRLLRNDDGSVKVSVGRVRRIAALSFEGNSAYTESDLRRETGLNEKIPFDPSILVEAGERIRQLYENLGFPKTQVDLKYTESSNTEVNVTVVVREGPQTVMDSFQVETANENLKKFLLRQLSKWRGEPLNERTLARLRGRMREKLSEEGYWRATLQDPEVQRDFEEKKATLTFRVLHPSQYVFESEGMIQILRSTIYRKLGLDNYYSANPNIAAELGSKVRAIYLSEGYARVQVESEELEGSRPGTRRIRVHVTEGPLVKIETFEFNGSHPDPEFNYVKFLRDHSSGAIHDKYYVKEDLDDGLKNLVTELWNRGYLHAKLVSTRTLYNKERTAVTVSVTIDEGPLTQVQKITFEGNASVAQADLLKVVNLEEGKPLRLNELDGAVGRIKQHYREHGFLEMELIDERDGLVTYNEDNTLVHLNFRIKEGAQVKVASILIEGNTLTLDEVILKELEFEKGDILTPQALEESTSRLQRLGFFSSIDIRTLEQNTPVSERTVVVKVQDRDPGLFNFGAGVTNERGLTLRGYTGVAYRNIFGTGRGVSARVDANYLTAIPFLEHKIALGYLEPYLLDTRTRGRVNLTRSTQVSDYDASVAQEANQITYSLEQDVTSHFLAIWDVWSFAHILDYNIETRNDLSVLDIAWTGFTFDFDYRDHPFNPTKGNFTRLNAEWGTPWMGSSGSIDYMRYFGSFTNYTLVAKESKVVWANSIRGGHIKNLSGHADGAVPFDKKGFLLGGQSTIRGFTPDEAFPNRRDFGSEIMNLKGSATMALFKSEMRFPIYGNFAGAVFYDGGQVFLYGDPALDATNQSEGWRHAAGLAARYVTPVGAVSFEYGWKLPPRAVRNESAAALHFSIGTF